MPDKNQNAADARYDWSALADQLNRRLRLKTTPTGMKLFERAEDLRANPSCAGLLQYTLRIRSWFGRGNAHGAAADRGACAAP